MLASASGDLRSLSPGTILTILYPFSVWRASSVRSFFPVLQHVLVPIAAAAPPSLRAHPRPLDGNIHCEATTQQ